MKEYWGGLGVGATIYLKLRYFFFFAWLGRMATVPWPYFSNMYFTNDSKNG
jgi:hypothetical protein